ncbi:hypothetical protein FH972_022133 [Carpinus fangiana]|uniref:Uncharacterized protein n=1 Tax=Carpinus fangiana TaxID=176857 RepID=A0A5N6KRX2_9ROSI|nr:hypothetical protein FH972_022133 [Carpinus fangiana]
MRVSRMLGNALDQQMHKGLVDSPQLHLRTSFSRALAALTSRHTIANYNRTYSRRSSGHHCPATKLVISPSQGTTWARCNYSSLSRKRSDGFRQESSAFEAVSIVNTSMSKLTHARSACEQMVLLTRPRKYESDISGRSRCRVCKSSAGQTYTA